MGYEVKDVTLRKFYQPGDWHRDRGGRWLVLRLKSFKPDEAEFPPTYRVLKFLPKPPGQKGFFAGS